MYTGEWVSVAVRYTGAQLIKDVQRLQGGIRGHIQS